MADKSKIWKVFQSRDDYINWQKYIDHCSHLVLNVEERNQAKDAFLFFREEFGTCFLKEGFLKKHPLMGIIGDFAPWTRKYLAELAKGMRQLKTQKNYQSLHKRLKRAETFAEALSVLETAFRFQKAGFSVEIDPTVEIKEARKIPDLRLWDSGSKQELFVEVSSLGESDSSKRSEKLVRSIWNFFILNPWNISFCGVIHHLFLDSELVELMEKLEELCKKLATETGFMEFVNKNFEIAIATKEGEEKILSWAKNRDLEIMTIKGPDWDSNQLPRLKRKIRAKQKQLPRDKPSLVVIWSHFLLIWRPNLSEIFSDIKRRLPKYPHLLGAVIAGSWLGEGEDFDFASEEDLYIGRKKFDLIQERLLFIRNPKCQLSISKKFDQKIIQTWTEG